MSLFTKRFAIVLILVGIASVGTAVWGVPPSGNTAQPINVGVSNQSKLGAFAVKTNNITGTKFSVGGLTQIKRGSSFINNPLIINGVQTKLQRSGQSANLNITNGGFTINDAPGDTLPNNENIWVDSLTGASQTPLCATQTGQLIRC